MGRLATKRGFYSMLTKKQYEQAQLRTVEFFEKAGIAITEEEKKRIEVIDFGYGDLEKMGLEILIYVNTPRVCAKELVLFLRQTCAEHVHPTIKGVPGKEETFRCRWGKVYMHVPGEKTKNPKAVKLERYEEYLTCMNEIELNPGEQYTLTPDTPHWFQAGECGAVISEFSTTSTDEQDMFKDTNINSLLR